MGRSFFRRGVTIAAAVGLLVGCVAVEADAAGFTALSSGHIDDALGDTASFGSVPVDEPRADLTRAKAIVHGDGRIELTATVARPTDPATDPGWADGGSGLLWIVDTNGDGTPDYLVVRGNFPDGSVVEVADAETFTPVDGCNAAADYTPVRYSVTLPPACLGSPTAFRWGVVMSYDADHGDDRGAAADSAPGVMEELATGPGTVTDPTGDVTIGQSAGDPRADITGAGAAYDGGHITLTATLASPTDPRVDPGWTDGRSGLTWMVGTKADTGPDYYVNLTGPGFVVHVVDTSLNELCTGSATYSPPSYSVTFDAACIGSPAAFLWSVAMAYDETGVGVYDIAPDSGQPAGPVTAPPRSDPDPPLRPSGAQSGYWMITDAGDVFGFGDARHYGNDNGFAVKRVDIEPTRSGSGYWILAASGAVTVRGDARPLGDAAGRLQPGEQAAALSATPGGDGYWIFTDRGRGLPFGASPFLGDMTGVTLNGAVLDSVATPTGQGYWMVGSDGGIFNFGDATYHGSTGAMRLNKPVMSMAADPDGAGYWLVASDGGIFAFDAPFYGSMGATRLNKPISGIVPGNAGYLMVGEDGGIFAFGNVAFHGSLGAAPPAAPVVAVALAPAAG